MTAPPSLRLAAALFLGLSTAVPGRSQNSTIAFDTGSASEWTVNAGGLTGATPYVVAAGVANGSGAYENCLSVTSDGFNDGAFLPGGSLANFDGFWVASFTFSLPANATSISLSYSDFYADDRAVLTLNGSIFDSTRLPYFNQLNSVGSMVFTDGGPLLPYSSFGSPDGFVSGTVTTGFDAGGVNTIEAIINNTKSGVFGPDVNLQSGDVTFLGLSGTISYTVAPEPATVLVAAIAPVALLIRGITRRARSFRNKPSR